MPRAAKGKTLRQKQGRSRGRLIALVVVALVAVLSVFLVSSMLQQPPSVSSSYRAAIVDQLSLTYPNQTFVDTATRVLEQAGYTVDYYPGEVVTVDFYRDLPTRGYGFLILRVHSGVHSSGNLVALFSSEVYSETKYLPEQLTDKVGRVWYGQVGVGTPYFGINQEFVRQSMRGRFQNAVVIMMGCKGLYYTDLMAQAFVEKGARAYVGWSDTVLGSHTDLATSHLVRHLVEEGQTMKQAVAQTMTEVGPDPFYDSRLVFYPQDAEGVSLTSPTASMVTIIVTMKISSPHKPLSPRSS